MDEYTVGEYVLYECGGVFHIGRVKSVVEDGAFVCYHEGDTAAKTPFERMHKIKNGDVIKETTLGGSTFGVKW